MGLRTDSPLFTISLLGKFGTLLIDILTIEGEQFLLENFVHQDEALFKTTANPIVYFFVRKIEDVVRSIHENGKPSVTGEDGREAVKFIDGIYRSGREHITVSFS